MIYAEFTRLINTNDKFDAIWPNGGNTNLVYKFLLL